jgi:hypothetical protein
MLLEFIVSEHGIEANPEKIAAIMKMGPIQNLKGCSGSPVALQPLVASSHASVNDAYPFISF